MECDRLKTLSRLRKYFASCSFANTTSLTFISISLLCVVFLLFDFHFTFETNDVLQVGEVILKPESNGPCIIRDDSGDPLMIFRNAYIVREKGEKKIWVSSEIPRELSREYWEAPGIIPDLTCNDASGLFKPNFIADKWPFTTFVTGFMLCSYLYGQGYVSIYFQSQKCDIPITVKNKNIQNRKQVTTCISPFFGTPDVEQWFSNNIDDFDHVYIYQTGDIPPRIEQLVNKQMVTLINFQSFLGERVAYHSQSLAFEDCIKRAELDGFEWIAFTDFDSHISSRVHASLHDYIDSLDPNACYVQMKLFDQPPSCDPIFKDNLFPRFCDKYMIKPDRVRQARIHSAIPSKGCDKIYPTVQELHHLHLSDVSLRDHSRFKAQECSDARSWEDMESLVTSKECKW